MSVQGPIDRKAWYAEYLRSEHWERTRAGALYYAQNRCQNPMCLHSELRSFTDEEIADWGYPYRLEVHHLTYERVGCERFGDLIVLCSDCHRQEHGLPPDEPPSLLAGLVKSLTRMVGKV
jgi:hypothetical protein